MVKSKLWKDLDPTVDPIQAFIDASLGSNWGEGEAKASGDYINTYEDRLIGALDKKYHRRRRSN